MLRGLEILARNTVPGSLTKARSPFVIIPTCYWLRYGDEGIMSHKVEWVPPWATIERECTNDFLDGQSCVSSEHFYAVSNLLLKASALPRTPSSIWDRNTRHA